MNMCWIHIWKVHFCPKSSRHGCCQHLLMVLLPLSFLAISSPWLPWVWASLPWRHFFAPDSSHLPKITQWLLRATKNHLWMFSKSSPPNKVNFKTNVCFWLSYICNSWWLLDFHAKPTRDWNYEIILHHCVCGPFHCQNKEEVSRRDFCRGRPSSLN